MVYVCCNNRTAVKQGYDVLREKEWKFVNVNVFSPNQKNSSTAKNSEQYIKIRPPFSLCYATFRAKNATFSATSALERFQHFIRFNLFPASKTTTISVLKNSLFSPSFSLSYQWQLRLPLWTIHSRVSVNRKFVIKKKLQKKPPTTPSCGLCARVHFSFPNILKGDDTMKKIWVIFIIIFFNLFENFSRELALSQSSPK